MFVTYLHVELIVIYKLQLPHSDESNDRSVGQLLIILIELVLDSLFVLEWVLYLNIHCLEDYVI
jgi:hypothetical protein